MKQTDDGNNGDFGAVTGAVTPAHVLRQIVEVGTVCIADWTDEFVLHRGIPVEFAQDEDAPYFARVVGGLDGYKIAVLLAFIVAEHSKEGKIVLPDFLTEGIKFGKDLEMDDDPGATGNVGTLSDNANIKILGADGHPL